MASHVTSQTQYDQTDLNTNSKTQTKDYHSIKDHSIEVQNHHKSYKVGHFIVLFYYYSGKALWASGLSNFIYPESHKKQLIWRLLSKIEIKLEISVALAFSE